MILSRCFIQLFLLFFAIPVFAQVKLPSLFGNGMVLQQKSLVKLWGTSKPGNKIKVMSGWAPTSQFTQSDKNGNWSIELQTPSAGGPYSLTFDDGEKLEINDVLIGEVWVCSGQSNMEMPVNGRGKVAVLNASELMIEAKKYPIRLFHVPRSKTKQPSIESNATWQVADSLSVGDFSAVGYQFALELQQQLKVPIGVIQAAFGGTKVQAWMDSASIEKFPELKEERHKQQKKEEITKSGITALYNAMINPIIGYKIKGVIWYQGEGNRGQAKYYNGWFTSMVEGWRSKWGQGEFPFYFVQIAPFDKGGVQSAFLREAQLESLNTIPNSGMAVTLDVGLKDDIHPPDKTTVAHRLALLALSRDYSLKVNGESPRFKNIVIKGNRAKIYFDKVSSGLRLSDSDPTSFEIAGKDKKFYPASAKITAKDEVTLQSQKVPQPVAVRYCFYDWAIATLYNEDGLPVPSFRTDNWE